MNIEQALDNLLLHENIKPTTRKRLVRLFHNPSAENAALLIAEEQNEFYYLNEFSDGPNIECYADKNGW